MILFLISYKGHLLISLGSLSVVVYNGLEWLALTSQRNVITCRSTWSVCSLLDVELLSSSSELWISSSSEWTSCPSQPLLAKTARPHMQKEKKKRKQGYIEVIWPRVETVFKNSAVLNNVFLYAVPMFTLLLAETQSVGLTLPSFVQPLYKQQLVCLTDLICFSLCFFTIQPLQVNWIHVLIQLLQACSPVSLSFPTTLKLQTVGKAVGLQKLSRFLSSAKSLFFFLLRIFLICLLTVSFT